MKLQSGFNPDDGICWNFRNPGDRSMWHCNCPACTASRDRWREIDVGHFGRCRSGKRWFYHAGLYPRRPHDEIRIENGFADAEEAAMIQAMDAVRRLKELPLAHVVLSHGQASYALKQLNRAKRADRPPSKARDTNLTEYLYVHNYCWTDGWVCDCVKLSGAEAVLYHTVKHQILKKTAKRIYYHKKQEDLKEDPNPAVVDGADKARPVLSTGRRSKLKGAYGRTASACI